MVKLLLTLWLGFLLLVVAASELPSPSPSPSTSLFFFFLGGSALGFAYKKITTLRSKF